MEAAYWSAQTALAATEAVLGGRTQRVRLVPPARPPCGRDYCGGYSYLNNAAIAAEAALVAGKQRVAILDVDYHHGNGTQDIFYDRADVLYASIHADPARTTPSSGATPTSMARARQRRDAEPAAAARHRLGRLCTGADQALDGLKPEPDMLIVSYGADTFEGDPISHFKLQTADYASMAPRVASLGLPTVDRHGRRLRGRGAR